MESTKLPALILAALLTMPALTASGQETLAGVSVNALKNPQEFDIIKIKKYFSKFVSIAPSDRDKINLNFYLYDPKSINPSQIELSLVNGDNSTELNIHSGGRVSIDKNIIDFPDDTVLVSNAPKNSFSIIYKIDIIPSAEGQSSINYLREALVQARTAWKKEYGIGAIFVPKFSCINFKSENPDQKVTIEDQPNHTIWSAMGDDLKIKVDDSSFSGDDTIHWDSKKLIRIAACK